MIRNWLSLTVEEKSAIHYGLRMAVGRYIGVFYTDGGIIGLKEPEWIQGAINVLIGIFQRVGLMANVTKSKTMTDQTGVIHIWMVYKYFSHIRTG